MSGMDSTYECGICGSGDLVIGAVVDGWEIACGGGHVVVPVPGSVYRVSTGLES